MAKQSALSIRILESVKKDLDKAAVKQRRSTSSLVQIIIDDYLQAAKTGNPKKYPNPDERLASGQSLMEMPLPIGKPLGDATREDLRALEEAYGEVGERMMAEEVKATLKPKKGRG